jgi:arylsulfatase A-like enzyme
MSVFYLTNIKQKENIKPLNKIARKDEQMIKYKKILISAFLIFLLNIHPWCIATTQAKAPHGIILISLDTLRADHLSIYGYHRNTSPFIDAFAKESIVFENAVVQSTWTLPSHMSIMTSLYPAFHGVKKADERLADDHLTLAELLQGGGYRTAAFTDGGWMRAVFGFDQGFDIYDDRGGGIAHILPRVKKWIDENKSEPFFLFIHCYDIHSPYNPPPPYTNIFHDFTYHGHLTPSRETLGLAAMNKLKVNDDDLRHFIALYDGGIRYTDKKIGEFLLYLQNSGLEDQSLIIITSDHGEAFKEHNSFLHWQLYYRPNLCVPLIMRIPNYPKKEIRIKELVQSIDLLPTILEIAGLPDHSKAQGESLLSLTKRHRNFFFTLQQVFHLFKKDSVISFAEALSLPFFQEYENNISIITGGYQMIYHLKSHSTQLFNLKVDPLAQRDIARDHDDITERLLSQFNEVYSVTPSHKPLPITLDEQTREQLEALGYLDSQEHVYEDSDMDGIPNKSDNCLYFPNPKQQDRDGDKIGDMCDECIDTDGDNYADPGFFMNTCAVDNCPNEPNPSQEDADRDGRGDECDNCFETPNGPKMGTCLGGLNDGWHCSVDKFCGLDGFCSMDQEDLDGDDMGDVCDQYPDDYDNDSIDDLDDNCALAKNPGQEDLDGDNMGDVCDQYPDDYDNDSIDDLDDTFMANYNQSTLDKPASAIDLSKGDFDCDLDVDEKDRIKVLEDLGRNSSKNPCPACKVGEWCSY